MTNEEIGRNYSRLIAAARRGSQRGKRLRNVLIVTFRTHGAYALDAETHGRKLSGLAEEDVKDETFREALTPLVWGNSGACNPWEG